MGLRIIITMEGLNTVLSNLEKLEVQYPERIQAAMDKVGKDALDVMQGNTHVRTGRLRAGDKLETAKLSFTLSNMVYYAKFVERGHMTRPGPHRHHVQAYPFLAPAVKFIEEVITDRLAAALQTD